MDTAHAAHLAPGQLTRAYRFGFALFLLAETMMFTAIFSTRFLLAGSGHPAGLDQPLAAAVTAAAAASLLPLRRLVPDYETGDLRRLRRALAAIAPVALVLLGVTAYEWTAAAIPAGSAYGGSFYLASGAHAAHVAAELLLVLAVAIAAARGRLTRFLVDATALLWAFVVAVWIVLYAVYYLA